MTSSRRYLGRTWLHSVAYTGAMRQPAAAPAGAPLHRQQRGRQRGARTHHRGAPAAQRARRPRAGPGGGPSAEHALDGCGCRPPGPRQRRHAAPAWAPLLLAATCLLAHARAQQQQQQPQPNAAAADSAGYRPWQYNKACRYSASNIPANLFKNGIDGGVDYLFPLETSQAVNRYAQPWEACVPNFRDAFSMPQVAAGWKLPCRWAGAGARGGLSSGGGPRGAAHGPQACA